MSGRLAVIVSTYNARDTLARVLDCYLRQTRLPDEMIVADDGSSDGTGEMVARWCGSATFPIRHVWQRDEGFRLARIRNLAVKAASADYIIFTDGDCLPHPRFVEDHARLARQGYFVQGKRIRVGREISPSFEILSTPRLLALGLTGKIGGIHHLFRLPGIASRKAGPHGIKTCNFAIYREDFVAVNGFNEDFVGWGREDSELVVRLYKYGLRRMDVSNSAVVFHLWHPESDRVSLVENDRLLEQTIQQPGYRCARGIEGRG